MSTMRAIKQLRKNLFLASNTTNAVTRSWKEKSVTTKTSSMTSSNMLGQLLQIDDDVRNALEGGRPVVALESTIVAHGMSFPDNLKLALDTEDILRSKGVTPATIAIKEGICRIGLSKEEIEDLARAGEEGRAKKCTTRDIPILVASTSTKRKEASMDGPLASSSSSSSLWGATTVASTMKLASLSGISTFVTGGIGGVHRNGENSMDVSADLTELSRTPVVVVSAGIKSILDIQKTLEVLETNSVPTFSWKTDEFPAFFSPQSGVQSPARVDGPEDVARIYLAGRALQMSHGMLVAVPNHDPAGAAVEEAIQEALIQADRNGVTGQAVTPYILKYVAETTGGDSLRSNISLVKKNAEVGAEIATAIASLKVQE